MRKRSEIYRAIIHVAIYAVVVIDFGKIPPQLTLERKVDRPIRFMEFLIRYHVVIPGL
ncbi:MAG TPA: hypothetical protein VFO63_00455 [Blastocatellia bacterium]|nr:hypothetical protein [Blastocatellia bacterium]